MADKTEIVRPDADSHFRLLPCKVCRSRDVAYVRHRAHGQALWCVRCLHCGHVVDKGTEIRHEAQIAWNKEERC